MKILNRLAVFLNIFTFISAIAGSIYLISADKDTIPTTLLIYSPFKSFLTPAIILGIFVGGTNLVSSIIFFMNKKYWNILETITGFTLCGWITGELLLIRQFSWLQVLYFLIGIFLILISFKKTYATLASL